MTQKPNLLTRLKYSVKFFKHGYRYFFHGGRETKSAPWVWPNYLAGQPQWNIVDFAGYAQAGFSENAVIFSAIMYKVRSLIAAPLRAYSGTPEKSELLPVDHPLTKMIARPNRWQSWPEFQGLAEVYLNLSGNCYIHLNEEKTAMHLLRPDQVQIVPMPGDKKELMGFLYTPMGKTRDDAIPYLPQDIMHIRLPNPLDPLDGLGYGLPPLSPAAKSTSVDNQVTKYLKMFFETGAMPPGLLMYEKDLDDADIARARERWQEIYGGSENWAIPAVLGSGGKYERLGLSFDEMGFGAIDERNEARMSMVIGVPPILIGTRLGLSRSSYGKAYEEARKAFWEDTMIPTLRMFETEYQHYLNQGDVFVAFDLSKVPALMPPATEGYQAARDAFQRGAITRNEYRAILHLDSVPDGDIYVMPATFTTVQAEREGVA